MGSMNDRARGNANKAIGRVKEAAGKTLGNDRLESEGQAQQLKGDGQKAMGTVKRAVKKGVGDVGEALKNVARKL